MKSFEIQRRERGKWIHDSYYDDETTALDQAKALVKRKLYDGIRVVEDVFVDESRRSTARYIYSHVSDKPARPERNALERNDPNRPPEEILRGVHRHGPQAPRGSMNLWKILLILSLLFAGGLAALAGIQALFNQ